MRLNIHAIKSSKFICFLLFLYSGLSFGNSPMNKDSLCSLDGRGEYKEFIQLFWLAVEENYRLNNNEEPERCRQLEDFLDDPGDRGLFLDLSNANLTDIILNRLERHFFTGNNRKAKLFGLNLSGNYLTKVERFLLGTQRSDGIYEQLAYLDLSYNRINTIFDGALLKETIRYNFAKSIVVLNLKGNRNEESEGITGLFGDHLDGLGQLRSFSFATQYFPSLSYLDLSGNKINESIIFRFPRDWGYYDISNQYAKFSLRIAMESNADGTMRDPLGFSIFHIEADDIISIYNARDFLNTNGFFGSAKIRSSSEDPFKVEGHFDFIDLVGRGYISYAKVSENDNSEVDTLIKAMWAREETCKNVNSQVQCFSDDSVSMPLGGCEYYNSLKSLEYTLVDESEDVRALFTESLEPYRRFCES